MFLIGQLDLLIYRDVSQTEFPQKKICDISESIEDTAVAEAQESTFSLAASATQAINFNSLTPVRKVYIYSDTNDLSVSFNGGAALTYKAMIPGIMPIQLTSLSVTNSSSSTATTVSVVLVTGA